MQFQIRLLYENVIIHQFNLNPNLGQSLKLSVPFPHVEIIIPLLCMETDYTFMVDMMGINGLMICMCLISPVVWYGQNPKYRDR